MSIQLPRQSARKPGHGKFTSGLVPVKDGWKIDPACVYVLLSGHSVRIVHSRNIRAMRKRMRDWRLWPHKLPPVYKKPTLEHIAWISDEVRARYLAGHLTRIYGRNWIDATPDQAWDWICAAAQKLQVPFASHDDYLAHCVSGDDIDRHGRYRP